MTVYVDILLFVNVAVDSALLWVTARILRVKPKGVRFVGGVLLSVAYGLAVCFDVWPVLLSVLVRLVMGALITAVTFGVRPFGRFLRSLLTFLFVSVSYIGILLSCQMIIPGARDVLTVRNGAVYYDLPVPYLLGGIAVLCLLQMILERVLSRRPSRREIRDCAVTLDGKSVTLRCLVDTGDLVREPLSGLPVVIVCRKCLESLVPFGESGGIRCDPSGSLYTRLRLVPFRGAGRSDGMLEAFRPDDFSADGVQYKVLVAVDPSSSVSGDSYDGIMPVL